MKSTESTQPAAPSPLMQTQYTTPTESMAFHLHFILAYKTGCFKRKTINGHQMLSYMDYR